MLPDSLIARASFTHGFPYYPNPNLPMALRPVVNRCANSPVRIDRAFRFDKVSEVEIPLPCKAVRLPMRPVRTRRSLPLTPIR